MEEEQIARYRHDLEYVRKAARQTEKDFERFGYQVELDTDQTGDWRICCSQLSDFITVICKDDSSRLPALLYHIDVPEHKIHPLKGCANPALTAEIIMQRELIKVIIKTIYSPR